MRWSLLAAVSVSPLMLFSFTGFGGAQTPEEHRISGPVVHENLAVYFIHGKSAPGKVPLTLEEAMAKGVVKVRETSNVNQLEIENRGLDEVFVQSGDIVKGGKQDRTLMVSLVLPPKSGAVPIASFCVEEGRWTARGREDVKQFSTASAAVPSREMKLAMKAPIPAGGSSETRPPEPANPAGDRGRMQLSGNSPANETGLRQQKVWDNVRKTQTKLTGNLGASVSSAQSGSSLQLALENEKLMDAQKLYINALKAAGESSDDIIGFVFAVNGALNSADIYPSNGLFRKMWTKLLTASVIEAIGHKDEPAVAPPDSAAASAFLAAAEAGKSSEKSLNAGVKLQTREADKAYLFETARAVSPSAPAAWVHKNYLAK
jgi:ARG and Rhodanese-Phosphatase-superfamily-associated Protein domain